MAATPRGLDPLGRRGICKLSAAHTSQLGSRTVPFTHLWPLESESVASSISAMVTRGEGMCDKSGFSNPNFLLR